MTSYDKVRIIKNLNRVKSSSNNIWSIAIDEFLKQPNNQERDYIELIGQIQSQIGVGDNLMKNILGDTYNFFKKYKQIKKATVLK